MSDRAVREQVGYAVASLTALLVAWHIVAVVAASPLMPAPTTVMRSLLRVLTDRAGRDALSMTLMRSAVGYLLAVLTAVPIGFALARTRFLLNASRVPIDFLRSIPTSALFFGFVALLGIGEAAKIGLVYYACVFPLLVSSIAGAREHLNDTEKIAMMRVIGANKLQHLFWLELPAALPQLFVGARVSASLALVVVIVSEMFLGSASGLGRLMFDAYYAFDIPRLFALLILLGSIGYLSSSLLLYVERRIVRWRPEGLTS